MRPSKDQVAKEQEGALKEALQLSNNTFFALAANTHVDSDEDARTSSPTLASPREEGPALTPHAADDL
ncbi:hypothetical protein NDU88_005075 [Pleurodeles waltl]|uniref:Uncharacterized protein n=1 Tax=Pleurodeles waltl TaxID=8319 RepID=A0AAV7WX89_PLEWA|nr:hypothetical protein NDU88_005075 [Pleurodeles waltl]